MSAYRYSILKRLRFPEIKKGRGSLWKKCPDPKCNNERIMFFSVKWKGLVLLSGDFMVLGKIYLHRIQRL